MNDLQIEFQEEDKGIQAESKIPSYQIQDPAERARRWAEEYEERIILEGENQKLKDQRDELLTREFLFQQMNSEINPKCEYPMYFDVIMACEDPVPTSVLADDYGIPLDEMNRLLEFFDVQKRIGKYWILNPTYNYESFTETHLDPEPSMLWTQRGRCFINEIFQDAGILPVIGRGRKSNNSYNSIEQE